MPLLDAKDATKSQASALSVRTISTCTGKRTRAPVSTAIHTMVTVPGAIRVGVPGAVAVM